MSEGNGKIRITVPVRSSHIYQCLGSAQRDLFTFGLDRADLAHTPGSPVQVTRNNGVREFLETDREWMLWIDDDIMLPEGGAQTMMSTAEEIGPCVVSAICPIIQFTSEGNIGIAANVAVKVEQGIGWLSWKDVQQRSSPFDVMSCGAGCILVHRKIYESLEWPWFEWVQSANGTDLGEDCYFGEKVLANGFRIVAEPRVWAEHWNTVPLLKMARTYSMDG